jgi:hypothetical protein
MPAASAGSLHRPDLERTEPRGSGVRNRGRFSPRRLNAALPRSKTHEPYRQKEVSKGQVFFWILFVPVLLLILLSMLPFRFPLTITEIPTSLNMCFEIPESCRTPLPG